MEALLPRSLDTYDQVQTQFRSRDPIGYEGSPWNLYEYADSMPLIQADALGLCADTPLQKLREWFFGKKKQTGGHKHVPVRKPLKQSGKFDARCKSYKGFWMPRCCATCDRLYGDEEQANFLVCLLGCKGAHEAGKKGKTSGCRYLQDACQAALATKNEPNNPSSVDATDIVVCKLALTLCGKML